MFPLCQFLLRAVCVLQFTLSFSWYPSQVSSDPVPSGVLISTTKGSQVDRMTSQIPPVVKLFSSWRKWSNPTKHTLPAAAGLLTGGKSICQTNASTHLVEKTAWIFIYIAMLVPVVFPYRERGDGGRVHSGISSSFSCLADRICSQDPPPYPFLPPLKLCKYDTNEYLHLRLLEYRINFIKHPNICHTQVQPPCLHLPPSH